MPEKETAVSLRGIERRALTRGLLLGAAVIVAVSACSDPAEIGDGAPAGRTTTTSRDLTTTSGPGDAADDGSSSETLIKERYLKFWEARFEANEAPVNPELPALRELATGPQLERVLAETRANQEAGLAFRRPEPSVARHDAEVGAVVGDRADVRDCIVSDGVVYRTATGEIVSSTVTTRSVDAVMRLVEDSWRVESTSVLQQWEGVAGCALAQQ
jgi:hypothetical protein